MTSYRYRGIPFRTISLKIQAFPKLRDTINQGISVWTNCLNCGHVHFNCGSCSKTLVIHPMFKSLNGSIYFSMPTIPVSNSNRQLNFKDPCFFNDQPNSKDIGFPMLQGIGNPMCIVNWDSQCFSPPVYSAGVRTGC